MSRLLLCTLMVSGLAYGASPVATVTSSKPFRLSGAQVPVKGVPNWPLLAGDKLEMGEAPGLIRFHDGTLIYVLPHSKLAIQAVEKQAQVRLEAGGLAYKYAEDSTVELAALNRRISSRDSGQGRLWFIDEDAWWHPANANYSDVVRVIHQANGDVTFVSEHVTLFTDFSAWQGYNPDWANAPGQQQPSGPLPPPAAITPENPPSISNWKP